MSSITPLSDQDNSILERFRKAVADISPEVVFKNYTNFGLDRIIKKTNRTVINLSGTLNNNTGGTNTFYCTFPATTLVDNFQSYLYIEATSYRTGTTAWAYSDDFTTEAVPTWFASKSLRVNSKPIHNDQLPHIQWMLMATKYMSREFCDNVLMPAGVFVNDDFYQSTVPTARTYNIDTYKDITLTAALGAGGSTATHVLGIASAPDAAVVGVDFLSPITAAQGDASIMTMTTNMNRYKAKRFIINGSGGTKKIIFRIPFWWLFDYFLHSGFTPMRDMEIKFTNAVIYNWIRYTGNASVAANFQFTDMRLIVRSCELFPQYEAELSALIEGNVPALIPYRKYVVEHDISVAIGSSTRHRQLQSPIALHTIFHDDTATPAIEVIGTSMPAGYKTLFRNPDFSNKRVYVDNVAFDDGSFTVDDKTAGTYEYDGNNSYMIAYDDYLGTVAFDNKCFDFGGSPIVNYLNFKTSYFIVSTRLFDKYDLGDGNNLFSLLGQTKNIDYTITLASTVANLKRVDIYEIEALAEVSYSNANVLINSDV